MTTSEYLLDNRAAAAQRRFGALSALFDDVTFRHVEALGIQRGWRCWEVGAGGPSVPNWLAGRTGPDGHVLATDIDTSWIDGVAPQVEVGRHDLARDDLPPGAFDLIHARLVLCWIPQRDEALRRMAGALRLAADRGLRSRLSVRGIHRCPPPRPRQRQQAARRLRRPASPARNRSRLRQEAAPAPHRAGLADVAADAYMPVSLPAVGALDLANFDQLRDALLAQGLATAEEIDRHRAAVDRGTGFASPPLISAWGRKPS